MGADETTEERTLYLNGVISDETWWGDEVTPKMFKDDLLAGSGNVTVWINSPGGDVFAAAQIYNMLMDYTEKSPSRLMDWRQAQPQSSQWRAVMYIGVAITDRRYIGYEQDTGYHHYAIDVAKEFTLGV